MEMTRRAILTAVAEGRLAPEEAAARLEELDAESAAGSGRGAADGVETVRISSELGGVQVIGDPAVREASAEGSHSARREGSVLVIESEAGGPGGDGFQFGRRGILGLGRRLLVRMNPALCLEAEVQAGSLSVQGVTGPIRAEIQAGSATIEGFRSPLDISVQAGSLRASGVLDRGASRVACEAGSVRLDLDPGSSVKVVVHSEMGRVTMPGGEGAWMLGGGDQEAVIGEGRGTLEIDSQMGTVRVGAGR